MNIIHQFLEKNGHPGPPKKTIRNYIRVTLGKCGISIFQNRKSHYLKASLTVEAALVMPIFLYFMLAFLYFIQIFTVQEQMQTAITKMGLEWSKTAYFYKDFPDLNEAISFDKTIFGNELGSAIDEMTDKVISGTSVKLYAARYLDRGWVKNSCIKGGFEGIDFSYSSITKDDNFIDIVLSYRVTIPIKIFIVGDMRMLQRVRLRTWTGYEVAAVYKTSEGSSDTIVYITSTGTVYHKSKDCSHIKLSIVAVQGIPDDLRNDSGSKYYRCEKCCTGEEGESATYYITSYGTRYHADRACSKIKRSVQEIPFSQIGSRKPCSRCGKE